MEEYLSPAFYLVPPIDDFWQNTIYINEASTPIGLDLFTTLAHEGYPGHLYQTVYYLLYSKEHQVPNIRHILNFNGIALQHIRVMTAGDTLAYIPEIEANINFESLFLNLNC